MTTSLTPRGYVSNNNKSFNIEGEIYKVKDYNSFVVNGNDKSNNYDVAYLAFESTKDEIDLFTDVEVDSDYVLKVYLFEKDTRNLYMFEVSNMYNNFINNEFNEVEPIAMVWFLNWVEPEVKEGKIVSGKLIADSDTKTYRSSIYRVGDRWTRTGYTITLIGTSNDGKKSQGKQTAKLTLTRIAESNYAAYRDKAWAQYRVKNVQATTEVKRGYAIQTVAWNAEARTNISPSLSLSIGVNLGPASASAGTTKKTYSVGGKETTLASSSNLYPKKATVTSFPSDLSNETHYYELLTTTGDVPDATMFDNNVYMDWKYDVYTQNGWGLYNQAVEIGKTITLKIPLN